MDDATRGLCSRCGAAPRGPSNTYCRPCFNEYRRERRRQAAEQAPVICSQCGQSFARLRGGQFLCSRTCYEARQRGLRGTKGPQLAVCDICGTSFISRLDARYCSEKCRKRGYYLNHRADEKFQNRRRTYSKVYNVQFADKRRAANRAAVAARSEYYREKARNYAARNKHRYTPWEKLHPERHSAKQRARTARIKKATPVPITPEQTAARLAYWANRCWMCGAAATAVDHVKPLAKGGLNVLANFRPACTPCNSAKHARWYGVSQLSRFVRTQ